MRVLMLDGHDRRHSEPLIEHTRTYLGKFGVELDRVRHRSQPKRPLDSYAALVANAEFPVEMRDQLPCYGKSSSKMPSRPETMRWMSDIGIRTMRWSLAGNKEQLMLLFDQWETDLLLLKRSGEWGGTSVAVFSRHAVSEMEWNVEADLFCPEVNASDGDVYKLEMFGPELLLGWVSRAPSARSRMSGARLDGLFGAYGRRELLDWSDDVLESARRFGRFAWQNGFGPLSLDYMRNPDGQYEAIEVNLGNAAIWWTSGFPEYRARYARAVHKLLVEHHAAGTNVVSLPARCWQLLCRLPKQPKLLVREIQGSIARSRKSRELENKYAS